MSESIQQEFSCSLNNISSYNNGKPIIFTIRKASQIDNENRRKQLLLLKEKYKKFVEFGVGIQNYEWKKKLQDKSFINDKKNRLDLCKDNIEHDVLSCEVSIALSAYNSGSKKLFKFKKGYSENFYSAWDLLPDEIKRELHVRALELNQEWIGGSERIIEEIITDLKIKKMASNFSDLSLAPDTVFNSSKSKILNLIEDIKKFVFVSEGTIRHDVNPSELGLRETIPQPQNIVLWLPNKIITNHKILLKGFIGIVEHGFFEVKIVAKRDKLAQWDCYIEDITATLRVAIKWWKDNGLYTDEELDAINDAEYYSSARYTSNDLISEYGLGEDDY